MPVLELVSVMGEPTWSSEVDLEGEVVMVMSFIGSLSVEIGLPLARRLNVIISKSYCQSRGKIRGGKDWRKSQETSSIASTHLSKLPAV